MCLEFFNNWRTAKLLSQKTFLEYVNFYRDGPLRYVLPGCKSPLIFRLPTILNRIPINNIPTNKDRLSSLFMEVRLVRSLDAH